MGDCVGPFGAESHFVRLLGCGLAPRELGKGPLEPVWVEPGTLGVASANPDIGSDH